MALMAILIGVGSVYGIMTQVTPLVRASQHWMNRTWSNEKLDPGSAVAVRRRSLSDTFDTNRELESQGFDDERQALLYKLSQQLLNISELIGLYRRGEIKELDALYVEADKVGWTKGDVDYMLKVTEVIPSAGDIIRYAVREIYSPEIAEAFGQYEELPAVLEKAKADLKAAGLPEATFTKEWAAHWLLPSIMQGFEMLHRGVIPDKSTAENPLSLERLMIALDIMPAWRDKLTAISYHPFTRVDVRRMHKLGVLDTEQMFTAYADVGFSPCAGGHEHATVTEAFNCDVCRHESKVGRMTDFTLVYNNDPEASELTIADKDRQNERDLTKSEVLSGYKEGLLTGLEVEDALGEMGYSDDETGYYLSKTDYDKDKSQSASYMRYLHDAYIRGVITFEETTDKLGALNLPAKQVEYLFNTWDLDKTARANKPTKSELSSFLRADIITESIFRTEMQGLGYPEKYLKWYLELIERGKSKE